jgi:L-ascorbate metabolism protein UlaG (beta-lactamase superfamily)
MTTDLVHWLGHASFRIDDPRGRVYIDPWKLTGDPPPAGLILITHAHYDHFSPDDIGRIRTPATHVCCTADVARSLAGPLTIVHPDSAYHVGEWDVQTVAAYNVDKEFHPRRNGWVGYLLVLSDGRRVFHAGDTDALPHHDSIRADIALLPCGGTYTMNADDAGALANRMKPAVLVPMHWGQIVGTREDAERVKRLYPATAILRPAG